MLVRDQQARLQRDGVGALVTPSETVYPCAPATAERLGTDPVPS